MEMRNPPKVSIVTPSFNQARFIEKTILSVLNQKYPNVEHIIVDGGSKDGTLEILRNFKDRVIWISEPDGGQADAVNKGIKRASGEIIGWLNSDDIYLNNAISQAVQVFMDKPEVDLVYGDFIYINKTGDPLLERKEIGFDFKVLLHGLCYIGQPATFFRKKLFEEVGYLDVNLRYAMDWEYFLRIAFSRKGILHVPLTWAGFRMHGVSKSISQQKSLMREHDEVKRRYWDPPLYRIRFVRLFHTKALEIIYRTKRKWLQLRQRHYIIMPGTNRRIIRKVIREEERLHGI